jgi:hypothetical protein
MNVGGMQRASYINGVSFTLEITKQFILQLSGLRHTKFSVLFSGVVLTYFVFPVGLAEELCFPLLKIIFCLLISH